MGGSVLVGADCERRSTIASEEASPKTARAKREDIFIAEARSDKQRTLLGWCKSRPWCNAHVPCELLRTGP